MAHGDIYIRSLHLHKRPKNANQWVHTIGSKESHIPACRIKGSQRDCLESGLRLTRSSLDWTQIPGIWFTSRSRRRQVGISAAWRSSPKRNVPNLPCPCRSHLWPLASTIKSSLLPRMGKWNRSCKTIDQHLFDSQAAVLASGIVKRQPPAPSRQCTSAISCCAVQSECTLGLSLRMCRCWKATRAQSRQSWPCPTAASWAVEAMQPSGFGLIINASRPSKDTPTQWGQTFCSNEIAKNDWCQQRSAQLWTGSCMHITACQWAWVTIADKTKKLAQHGLAPKGWLMV